MGMEWKILKREIIFKDQWLQMEASTCQLPDGRIIEPYYVRREHDFVVIVAVTKDRRLVLVRQYRHGVEKVLLEIPAGTIEEGEEAETAARRELLEETGYRAGSLKPLLCIAPNGTNSTGYAHCFLALDVELVAGQQLDAMEEIEVEYMELANVHQALRDGVFEQAVHVAALYRGLEEILPGGNQGGDSHR